jgi:hypothetical protein
VLILGSRKQDISQKQECRFIRTSKLTCVDTGQQEAGHLAETGTQVCPNKKNLSKIVLTKEEEKIYLCFFDGQQDERRVTETGMQVTF